MNTSLQRLNVATTRAKCLLIVIGNPETLQKASAWREFLRYCVTNEAVVGNEFRLKAPMAEVAEEEPADQALDASILQGSIPNKKH